jgi:biopolymer transport protein ExbD
MSNLTNTSQSAPMCDINTTPLVDVMLVLLIIFMITAPMMQHQSKVKLPLVGKEQATLTPPRLLQLTLSVDGGLRLDDVAISLPALQAQALQISQSSERAEFNLHIDPNAPYPTVLRVVSALKNSGAENLRFAELAASP